MSGKVPTQKKIWFLTGYLGADEEGLRKQYEDGLRTAFGSTAGKEAGFQFGVIHKCSKRQFTEIWRDESTYGIIWLSHAVDGSNYPIACREYKDSWLSITTPDGAIRQDAPRLHMHELPKASPNLCAVSLLSCGSAKLGGDIRDKLSRKDTALDLADGKLSFGRSIAQLERWIRDEDTSTSKTVSARALMNHAAGREGGGGSGCGCNIAATGEVLQRRPQSSQGMVISQDRFEPEHVFLPYKRIPQVGIEASHYTSHTIRYGDRVWYLAQDYGYTDRARFTKDVEELNPGINFRALRPGQTINVPTKVGVPRQLSTPYALQRDPMRRVQPEVRPSTLRLLDQHLQRSFAPPAPGPAPSTLRLLDQHLRKTWTPPASRPPEFDTLQTLKRIEREATERQRTQRWLQGVQKELDRRPGTGGLADTTRPSTLRILDQHLQKYSSPATRLPAFDTLDALKRLEREAADRQSSQRWLRQVQAGLDRRPPAGNAYPSTLDMLKRHLQRF